MPAKNYIKVSRLTMSTKYFKALERCLAKVDMKSHTRDFDMLYAVYKALRKHHAKRVTKKVITKRIK